jgi:hypothetical protein
VISVLASTNATPVAGWRFLLESFLNDLSFHYRVSISVPKREQNKGLGEP